MTIREKGGWDNWTMIPLEEFSCETRIQACIRENKWLEELKPCLNTCNTTLCGKEYDLKKEENRIRRFSIKN
jgi:hypothetical protein